MVPEAQPDSTLPLPLGPEGEGAEKKVGGDKLFGEETGSSVAPPPKSGAKITIFAEIPAMNTCKGIRLLPTQTLASFVSKLQRKKVLGTYRGDILITHRPQSDPSVVHQLPTLESPQTLWDLGVRDQDSLILSFELVSMAETDGGEVVDGRKKESLLGRFRSAAARTLRGSTTSPTCTAKADQPSSKLTVESEQSPGLVFGVPLELIADLGAPLMSVANPAVPAFIESAFDYLATSEGQTEGLFRLSGSASSIRALKRAVDAGERIDWRPGVDAHNAAGLIKLYLREFPEPLLTFALFDLFCQAAQCPDAHFKLTAMRLLLRALPVLNCSFLRYLFGQILKLCQNEAETKMGISNMATVLGPNLGRPEREPVDQESMLGWTMQATRIASTLLQHYDVLFDQAAGHSDGAIAIATYDYVPQDGDELALMAGGLVLILDRTGEDNWWLGSAADPATGEIRTGGIPSNYVRILYAVPVLKAHPGEEGGDGGDQLGMDQSGSEEEEQDEKSLGQEHCESEKDSQLDADINSEGLDGHHKHCEDKGLQPVADADDLFVGAQDSSSEAEAGSVRETLGMLAERVARLELELAEERSKRINLENIIPELLKNQDQVLALLVSLKERGEEATASLPN